MIKESGWSAPPVPARPSGQPPGGEPHHADLVHEAIVRHPADAVALGTDDALVTYGELRARSNRLARHLRATGVRRGDLVAVLLPRGVDGIVSVLAALTAGAAYLPVDAGYPPQRVRHMLTDSRARVLVTVRSLVRPDLVVPGTPVVLLDDDRATLAAYPDRPPAVPVGPGDLAYVIYTSGSTGLPKGVMVEHGSLRGLARWRADAERLGPDDRCLHLFSPGFDASVWDIWAPLVAGASLWMPDDATRVDPDRLVDWLTTHAITSATLPTPLAEAVLTRPAPPDGVLRILGAGGQQLLARPRPEHAFTTVNLYGPTEATVLAMAGEVAVEGDGPPSLGHPAAGAAIRLLTDDLRPVPAGSLGEVFIGGPGVARGYHDRPALTAERFPPDPYGPPGSRLYRTGDLARQLPDGTYHFAGRVDDQVKLHGHRIELGEIESVLLRHPDVRAAAVGLHQGTAGPRLVGYVVPEAGPDDVALAEHAARYLPATMVPAAWVRLTALPLTPHGKLDRAALPAPAERVGEAPRDDLERRVAQVWAEVLGRSPGRDDNFFSLGGHSLRATMVAVRLRERFGLPISAAIVFEAQTVAAMADRLRNEVPADPSTGGGEDDPVVTGTGQPSDPALVSPGGETSSPGRVLSFAQQRLWFLHTLDPKSTAYNTQTAWHIDGELDLDHLDTAIDEIIRRHEILRTTFAEHGGVPVQIIHPPTTHHSNRHDLTRIQPEHHDRHVRDILRAELDQPFDLATGPLLRSHVLQLTPTTHVLCLTWHHIVLDGWSVGVFHTELDHLYTDLTHGRTPSLPPLTTQYADIAERQRHHWQSDDAQRHLEQLASRLRDAPPVCHPPTDRPRPDTEPGPTAVHHSQLNPDTLTTLTTLAAQTGSTPFGVLLAAFQLLIHRYTHQNPIVIGTPLTGRTDPDAEKLIGFFVNTLPLAVDINPHHTFRQLLHHSRTVLMHAVTHQDIPFDKLVEHTRPTRDRHTPPLIQTVFTTMEGTEPAPLHTATMRPLPIDEGVAKFDLTVQVQVEPDAVRVLFDYACDLYEPATMAELADSYRALVAAVLAEPDRPLSTVVAVTAAQRERLADALIASPVPVPPGDLGCVPRLVAETTRRQPDALAVVDGTGAITYRELDEWSNHLAHQLLHHGARPDHPVAVSLSPGTPAITAMLAVLKAGAAYLPIDPTAPPARRHHLITNSAATILITEDPHDTDTPPGVVTLTPQATATAAPPPLDIHPEQVAYVIHTSGSTGTPKGVMVPHRALTNLVHWHLDAHPSGPGQRHGQVASLGFDAAIWEIWPALVSGATLHIADPADRLDPAALHDWLVREDVTRTFLPTPIAEAVLRLPTPSTSRLRTIFTGGDALTTRPSAQVPYTLFNIYGPTETTVAVTVGPVRPDGVHRPDLGVPIAGARIHLLDADLQLVPPGAPGEVCVAGDVVSRGYLNKPGQTAERFLPDPYGPPGSRLYRTGDLCRLRTDGTLEFLGRTDEQIAINGYRIEPGEIETALRTQPHIEAALVTTRTLPTGRHLIAYVTGTHIDTHQLRDTLHHTLPRHLVPHAIIALPHFPLTRNGKIDRNALPAPDLSARGEPPRDALERRVAQVWADVIGRTPGRDDNFFAFGGHSMQATMIAARLRETLGVPVSAAIVFEAQTVAAMADRLRDEVPTDPSTGGGEDDPVVTRAGQPSDPALVAPAGETPSPGRVLSFAQQRLWFLHTLDPKSTAYNTQTAWHIDGELDLDHLDTAINEIARRHEVLRTTFAEHDGVPVQIIHPEPTHHRTRHDLTRIDPEHHDHHIRDILRAELDKPFDLTTGPLLRCRTLRLSDTAHVLCLTWHHIVLDGWSVGVFHTELDHLYTDLTHGRAPSLPPLTTQYADIAERQRHHWQSDDAQQHLHELAARLRDAPPVCHPPTDRPRPDTESGPTAVHHTHLPAGTLTALAARTGSTPFGVLLAAFQLLIHRYTHQNPIVIGTPLTGRTDPDAEKLIGFFVNTLPLAVDINPHHTFRQLLHHSRTVLMHAVTHQDIPFDKLVEHTRPTRDRHTPPLIQTVFTGGNTTGIADEPMPLHTSTMRPVSIEPGTAKFDLTVHAEVGADTVDVYFSYARDLYEPGTMADLADSYRALVAAVLADPDRRLSTVEAVTDDQRRRLAAVSTGRRSGSDPARATRPAGTDPADGTDVQGTGPAGMAGWSDGARGCVPLLVAETARRQPDTVAVVDGAGAITYRELDEWSNHLAHQLLHHGARPDHPVAVSLPPGTPAITAMLAVLKAGAAYLPIDPTAPTTRRHHLITNSAATILITEHPHDTDTPPGIVTLTPHRCASPAAPRVDIHPEQVAYVIHTSGSTGTPKGVMVAHHALANLVRWHLDTYPSGPGEHHGQIASLGFDAAVWEIWPALVSGATLHIADPADRLDPTALHDWMHRQGLTEAFVPTPIAEAILRLPTPPTTTLRTLLTGGDALTTRPSARTPYALVNHYGPTEAAVVATAGPVRPDGTHRPDLGTPIDGARVHLLDAELRLVPPGAPGELCIAGDGLARGYLGRPGQTAERFLPDPYGPPGSRLYRTGDLCRLRTDGTLEFLGRTDEQIAINGYRIEPGEIETALRTQPHIEAALVTTRTLPTGRHLIAYVTGTHIDTHQLRDTLHHTLPRHLVPHAIIALPHFPLTRNGKIDRNALPAPDPTTVRSAPPGDAVQRQLAGIWATVLGTPVAGIGVRDDFFAVGGHSLLATQVTAQAGAAFEVDLPVAALFRNPTIAGLAGELRRVERRPGWVDTVAGLREAVAALTEDQARRALAAATRPGPPYDETGAPR